MAAASPRMLRTAEPTVAAVRADLLTITGHDLAEVQVTTYPRGRGRRRVYCVLALAAGRREIPLPQGAPDQISRRLVRAFPKARWFRAQDYDVATGVLAEHTPLVPRCLRGAA